MSELHALIPRKSKFTYKNREMVFRPFDLATQVWAYAEFSTPENANGLQVLSEKVMQHDVKLITQIGYYLLKDKREFKDYKDFAKFFDSVYDIFKYVLCAINETFGNANPEVSEDSQDYDDLKKLKASDLMEV